MKKFTLSILAVVMTAFVMTSCIDNAVSPEVKAIRAAQVNKINAQTALTTAQAAYQTALAARTNSEAALNIANAAAIDAETENQQIQNDRLLVTLEREQAAAEVYLAQQEKALQEAIDALAEYIAEHNLTLAAGYIEKYETAVDNARATAGEIADITYDIAVLQLYLADEDGETLETLREIRANAVADAEADLAAAEAALAIVEAVEADPTTVSGVYADLKAQIQDITNQVLALEIDLVPLDKALGDANDDLFDAEEAYSDNQDIIDEYEAAEDAVADAEADAADALADAEALNADDAEQLQPFVDALIEQWANAEGYGPITADLMQRAYVAVNAYKVEIAKSIAIDDDSDGLGAAQDDIDAIISEIDDLTDNVDVYMGEGTGDLAGDEHDYDSDGGDWTGSTVRMDDADYILDEMMDMLDNPDVATDYYLASGVYNQIANFYSWGSGDFTAYDLVDDIGRYDADNFISNFEDNFVVGTDTDLSSLVEDGDGGDDGEWDAYWSALSDVEDAQADLDDLDADDYADAVAAEPGLAADVDAADAAQSDAEDAYDVIGDQINDLNIEKGDLEDVLDAVENYIDGVNLDIQAFRDDVDDAKIALDEANYGLITVDFDEADATAQIEKEQAYLADLQAKLAGYQAEAAAWLALLNAALGN